jgi:glycine/serine hydroxymethyltransferase
LEPAYRAALEVIASVEPRIAAATRAELTDQRGSLKLIASENYASPAVLLTMGTWFSDKYAEGTIGHRFYAACQNVDTVESLAARVFAAECTLYPQAIQLFAEDRLRIVGRRVHILPAASS